MRKALDHRRAHKDLVLPVWGQIRAISPFGEIVSDAVQFVIADCADAEQTPGTLVYEWPEDGGRLCRQLDLLSTDELALAAATIFRLGQWGGVEKDNWLLPTAAYMKFANYCDQIICMREGLALGGMHLVGSMEVFYDQGVLHGELMAYLLIPGERSRFLVKSVGLATETTLEAFQGGDADPARALREAVTSAEIARYHLMFPAGQSCSNSCDDECEGEDEPDTPEENVNECVKAFEKMVVEARGLTFENEPEGVPAMLFPDDTYYADAVFGPGWRHA